MQLQVVSTTKQRSMAVVMVLALIASLVAATLGTGVTPASAQTQPVWRVDAQGNLTKDGVRFRVKGGSWFGLEGRHEPSNDSTNPSGAPMEMYMGNVFWAPSGRTYEQDAREFKAMGINVVRLPLVPQTLSGTDPQGMAPYLKNHDSVKIANSRLAIEKVLKVLNAEGIYVLLDIHSCSNYVGWRKGRFDARPPYADADRDNYDYKRENYSCAATNNPSTVTKTHPYDETKWKADLRTLAGMGTTFGVSNIMGIDIFNEPHDYSWAEWRRLIDVAYAEVNAVNPNILIFAQGIGTDAGHQDGTPDTTTPVPHGETFSNPNWGENLFEAGANPPTMPKNRLVYSPHVYGPSVFVQQMFMDPAQTQCQGKYGDEAGDLDCRIVINPAVLRPGWHEHFGYLKALGYGMVIGEFGGNFDWPRGTSSARDTARWGHITTDVDAQWQKAFVDYLFDAGIADTIYWSINPESGDTGGLYTTPYRAGSNESGWGTWSAVDSRKVTMLQKLWNAPFFEGRTPTPTSPVITPTRTPTNPPTGSVNVLVNPGFELDRDGNGKPDGWGGSGAAAGSSFSRSNAAKYAGTYSIRHRSTGNVSYQVSQTVSNVQAGQSYTISAWTNIPATSDTFQYRLQVVWRDASNAPLRTDLVKSYTGATSGWNWGGITRVAPAGATNAVVRMNITDLNATIYVDSVVFKKAS